MYFSSRLQAGRMLADKLAIKYKHEDCAIMALNDGGVIVGTQIAMRLHCVLTLMESAEISLPHEPTAVAGITSSGALAYNSQYSQGELYDLLSENRTFIEQEKQKQISELHQTVGNIGTVNRHLLNGHNVIVVSDGLKSGFEVDLAYEFLKPITIKKLIFAVPLASVSAVDHMHVLGDDLYCLDVLEGYADINHYFENNDVPSHDKILNTLEQIVHDWK